MPENPTVETSLDSQDWQIAFAPYQGHPYEALVLAFHLAALLKYVSDPEGVAAIERAIDKLFEFSQFNEVSCELYHAAVRGSLLPEQEKKIRELGIKF